MLYALNSEMSFSSGMTLNSESYILSPIILASGSMIAMMPVSDLFPILSPTFPCATVTISIFCPLPSHSRIIAL